MESTLSKPPLISRKSEETLRPGRWSVQTVSVRAEQASNKDREGSDPHWLRWRRPVNLAIGARHEATILSKILETVWRRKIILKEAGES